MMMLRNECCCLLLLLAMAAVGGASQVRDDVLSSSPAPPLRNSPQHPLLNDNDDDKSNTNKRQHVINRIYGPENARVRKNVAELEERMERFQTGMPNPDHKLEYKNHPFDPEQHPQERRGLQQLEDDKDIFQPMRIHFETQALDDQRDGANAAQIDFIKREILPRTGDFWSKALGVVPVSGNLFISTSELDNRAYCGDSEFTQVPTDHISNGLENTDLVLYISGTPSTRFCSGSTLAVAVACNFDQFDRPTAGAVVSASFMVIKLEVMFLASFPRLTN